MPTTPSLVCDKCRTVLTGATVNTPEAVACPGCHAPLVVRVFPAFFRPQTGGSMAESVGSEEDAGCFYHPRKKAVVPCGQCGRFLCALCDLDLDGRHLCPGCVEAGRTAGNQKMLPAGLPVQQRMLYDRVALSFALLPLFVWPCTLLTAPVALFLSIRHWNDPRRSPIPRGRWRLALAGLFALMQIIGWAYLFYSPILRVNAFSIPLSPVHSRSR